MLYRFLILLIIPVSLLAQRPGETPVEAWPRSFKAKPVDLRINDKTADGFLVVESPHFRMVAETRPVRWS